MNVTARENKELKRAQAEERNAIWSALSFEEQLNQLDITFGKDKGAAKQRLKIAKKIQLRDLKPVKAEKTAKPAVKAKERNKKRQKK